MIKYRGEIAEFPVFDLLSPLLSHSDPYLYAYFNPYLFGESRTVLLPHSDSSGVLWAVVVQEPHKPVELR